MRRTLALLPALFLLYVFAVTAFAHPGKTDSSGGHTDRSTGEYHYHHGYPAHDHYDIDGDGDLDCPYDFEDKTNHKSSGENSSYNEKDSRVKEPEYPNVVFPRDNEAAQISFADGFFLIFEAALGSLVAGLLCSNLLYIFASLIFGKENGGFVTVILFFAISLAAFFIFISEIF